MDFSHLPCSTPVRALGCIDCFAKYALQLLEIANVSYFMSLRGDASDLCARRSRSSCQDRRRATIRQTSYGKCICLQGDDSCAGVVLKIRCVLLCYKSRPLNHDTMIATIVPLEILGWVRIKGRRRQSNRQAGRIGRSRGANYSSITSG